ncbi:MAG: hypothetical protein IPK50_22725 [Fibrobacterota bacterium]|nr:hypothetical protein [Fibrobacterota bacterium]QQS05059.1 MAG: hypothetical protein IPK50_22725 [Fibrobacterota bacterium]
MNSAPTNQPKKKGIAAWKIVVGILGVCVALLGLLVVVVVIFVSTQEDSFMKDADLARERGTSFGKTHDQRECVTDVLSRLDSAGTLEQVIDRIFLDECLAAAQPSDNFCRAVPPKSEFLATVSWRLQACTEYGKPSNEDCGRTIGEIQEFCHPKPRKPDSTRSAP